MPPNGILLDSIPFRDLQPNNMKTVRGLGTLRPKRDISIKSLLGAGDPQGTLEEKAERVTESEGREESRPSRSNRDGMYT